MDGEHADDAYDGGEYGGGKVVHQSTRTHTSTGTRVQLRQTWKNTQQRVRILLRSQCVCVCVLVCEGVCVRFVKLFVWAQRDCVY